MDGVAAGSEATTPPYTPMLDTTSLASGTHTLVAVLRDAYGDTAYSNQIVITVKSGTGGGGIGTGTGTGAGISGGNSGKILFLRNLVWGDQGADVSLLQQALIADGDYPEARITGYYGTLTMTAVERFQVKYGITSLGGPGYGAVGPKTRAKLNALFAGGIPSVPAAPQAPSTTPAAPAPPTGKKFPQVTGVFYYAQTGQRVITLQSMLAEDPSVYPEGRITGYYGVLTVKAVERFQLKYGISTLGAPGYGVVGPKTKAKLNALYGE